MEANGKRTADNQKNIKKDKEDRKDNKSVDKTSEKVEKIDKPVKWAKNKHTFVVAGKYKNTFQIYLI